MANITIFVPGQEPLQIDLDGLEQVSIGRGPDKDVVVEHASISGAHAILKNVEGVWYVEDLGSTNGTFVDGSAISESPLVNGSKITFGTVEADFESYEEAAEGESGGYVDDGSGGYGGPMAALADTSVRPAGFRDLSPIEKVVKKDTMGMVAMILGIVGIVAAVGLVIMSVTMTGQ